MEQETDYQRSDPEYTLTLFDEEGLRRASEPGPGHSPSVRIAR